MNFNNLSTYDYNLPRNLIAQRPLENRSSSRLLVVDNEQLHHKCFDDISAYIKPGDVIVRNHSKVIPARLNGRKDTGAKIEVLLLNPIGNEFNLDNPMWEAMIRPAKRVKVGSLIKIGPGFSVIIKKKNPESGIAEIELKCDYSIVDHLEDYGATPIPPYIDKPLEKEKAHIYQTCYSKIPGSVAAPTAGFHFTEKLDNKIRKIGVKFADVLLHVGIGTFRPVSTDNVSDHNMHSEYYDLTPENAEIINSAKRVIAVGTTSVRVLETCSNNEGKVIPQKGWTDIFIRPGYEYSIVDLLITNFHLPCSTLIMLVAAFGGYKNVMNAYKQAVLKEYRFYSFGDSMLVFPDNLKKARGK